MSAYEVDVWFAIEDPPNPDAMPWVIAACDEYTWEAWGHVTPTFVDEAIAQHKSCTIRHVKLRLPEQVVRNLFEPPVHDVPVMAIDEVPEEPT